MDYGYFQEMLKDLGDVRYPGSSKIVAVIDFDGTISDSIYPRKGRPREGVKECLQLMRDLGWHILISSARNSKHWEWETRYGGLVEMRQWLQEHEIPYDFIDDGTDGKPLGHFYFDDRGVHIAPDSWPAIMKVLRQAMDARKRNAVR